MSVSFDGFGTSALTFACADEIQPGTPVKMTAPGEVAPCSQGDEFCGAVASYRGGYAGVNLCGTVTLALSGTAPSAGYAKLAADGSGGVAVSDSGREYLVLDTDTAAGTVTILL
jgi:hypothetical protein